MALFLLVNGPCPTTVALGKVATGTAIKTMLQFQPNANAVNPKILEWGMSFDGIAAAVPMQVELIETGTVAATVTAFVQADIHQLDSDSLLGSINPLTNMITAGTTASGYTSSGEGSITVARYIDSPQLIAPTNQYIMQRSLGREGIVQPGKIARIRITAAASVGCYCYMIVQF